MTNDHGHDPGDKDRAENHRPDVGPTPPNDDKPKSNIHQTGPDPLKSIPATEGGEA